MVQLGEKRKKWLFPIIYIADFYILKFYNTHIFNHLINEKCEKAHYGTPRKQKSILKPSNKRSLLFPMIYTAIFRTSKFYNKHIFNYLKI